MDWHAGDDVLARPVHDPRSQSARPTRAVTRSTATRVITHRIERELFE